MAQKTDGNRFDFSLLRKGMPGLTKAAGTVLAEAAIVCLATNSHTSGVKVVVEGAAFDELKLTWGTVTSQQNSTYNDLQEATEWGASGIGIIVVSKTTGLVVVERSRKGTGFDYWFGEEGKDDLFQRAIRFESSGILNGNPAIVESRIKQKIEQVKQSSETKKVAYISVVEFSQPRTKLAVKK